MDDDLDLGRGGEPDGPAAPPRRSEAERAIDLAYKAVARRERTVAELSASGFLDDARYAVRFAEDKRELAQWGSERIARELTRRGVAPELIEAALCDRTEQAELSTALTLLEQRFPAPPADDRERDRAWRLLVRRGYAPEVAYEAVRALGRRPRAA